MSGETPLAREIRQAIRAEGPMPIDRFMSLCLTHPEHGYYTGRDPFGARGDFVTAPEVSQIFGELVGVWCATEWEVMGKPAPFSLVELGPGRGTFMSDIIRATRSIPGFHKALSVRLVEASPVLTEIQRHALAGISPAVTWHGSIEELPSGPCLVVANEFFDALPVLQFVRTAEGWRERRVGVDERGALAFVLSQSLLPADRVPDWAENAADDTIIEVSPAREEAATALARRIATGQGVALIVDYGHGRSAPGETLQAVRRHDHVGLLETPGLADLSAHVDFGALSRAFRKGGAVTHGPLEQGEFLARMFIEERAEALKSHADPAGRHQIDTAVRRLVAEDQMGRLFKVLAACHPDHPTPYPFGESRDD